MYYRAGARYFVAQAMHHDNFFNYDSKIHPFNSVNIGPGKDICALWKAAADKHNMPFGLTEHLGALLQLVDHQQGQRQLRPLQGRALRRQRPPVRPACTTPTRSTWTPAKHGGPVQPWLTSNKEFQAKWLSVMKELVDKFHPNLLYSDSGLPFEEEGERLPARLGRWSPTCINDSIQVNGSNQAVYTQEGPPA